MAGVGDEAGGGGRSSRNPGPPANNNTQVQVLSRLRPRMGRNPVRQAAARWRDAGAPLMQPLVPERWGAKKRLRFVEKHPQIPDTTKRQCTEEAQAHAQTTMMDSASAVLEFMVNYEQTKHLAAGEAVHSDAFPAGGHTWRVNCYPRGIDEEANSGSHLSIFLELLSNSGSVSAIFEAFLMDKSGEPSLNLARRVGVHVFRTENRKFGWPHFLRRPDLVNVYLKEGHITFVCAIMVLHGNSIPLPCSDIGEHLGNLLDSTDGSDVSFVVDGETFHAHRAVLAARSPVFNVELLGSMAEATMSSITLHDITPATFEIMLRFMYTDVFPGDDELGDSPSEMVHHLLAAADRYALHRLKLMCAQKLWDNVSVDTVGDALACADMYDIPELKNRCIGFVVDEKNFKKVVLTDGFMNLGQKFPSIVAEVREQVEACMMT
ncbi:unnamed protein product [Urochloa decumbens]|uniref:Uncharacterized protein n=1 Tax=Urochloa decumbens TaxID=240449 RepID=A0ABC9BNV5_9POAL